MQSLSVGDVPPLSRTGPWQPLYLASGSLQKWTIANVAVALFYFLLAAVVSRFFAAYGLFPAPIWLPASIATIAGMMGGARLLPGIFLGSFAANAILFDPALYVSTFISLTNALGPVAGAAALRRVRPAGGLFASFAGVVAFILCMTVLSPAISAAGGALTLSLGKPADFTLLYQIWISWWLTDAGGALYLAPALILWLGLEREPSGEPRLANRDLAVWVGNAALAFGLFLTPPPPAGDIRSVLPFLLAVPLSWVALRMSLRSAYTLVSLVAIVACAGTVAGHGPFQAPGGANPLQLVGTLVVLLAMTVLTIVALFTERREAQSASRVKSMFLANTSHELRTPLGAIIGYASLITDGAPDAARHAAYAREIARSGEHLLALINGLLDISKIEAGRFDLHEERVDLADLVDEAVGMVRAQALAKGISLRFDAGPGLPAARADAQALRQVLVNLLANAVKFTPAGGRVRVAGERLADGGLAIRVSDTGIGIAAEALKRVFLPFERVRDGAAEIEGAGLGLSITRGLMHLHGGDVTLASAPGRGTVATLTLPPARLLG